MNWNRHKTKLDTVTACHQNLNVCLCSVFFPFISLLFFQVPHLLCLPFFCLSVFRLPGRRNPSLTYSLLRTPGSPWVKKLPQTLRTCLFTWWIQVLKNLLHNLIPNQQSIKKAAKTMPKIELCLGWGPQPSVSVNHRQTGWGLYQRRWSNDACATPQQPPRHELAWIWTNFLSEQCWATDFNDTAAGRTANDSLYDARARLKIRLQ